MLSRLTSGTASLILGDRPSVRLPRRIVPICVSDPIGVARPFRTAMTPAMVVVLTAPSPTRRMPNLPFAGAISGVFTAGNYIICGSCRSCGSRGIRPARRRIVFFNRKPEQKHALAIAMTGVNLGDRLLQVGCTDASLSGAIGSKVGLSGRVCAIVADNANAQRARRAAERSGFLLELEIGN